MKTEKKSRRVKDRILDTPSEANREKHINFVAQERGDTDPAAESNDNKLIKRKRKEKSKHPKK